jgi:hypothetical protein
MQSGSIDFLNFVLTLFKAMQKDNLGYVYRGRFNQEITDNILALTENKLEKEEQSSKIKKRVYSILVECLQNITRHQDDAKNDLPDSMGLFVIQKQDEKYFITTGNMVMNHNIDYIKNLIETINSLEKEELKNYYKMVLEDGSLSAKGGAGLGLIDMARKSGNKLLYQFRPVENNMSFFYLHTIPSLENVEEVSISKVESLNNIIDIHNTLNVQNILLVSNGPFNQESLMILLASLEGQMTGTISHKKKVFYIVVEMLQNIVKHGYSADPNASGIPGIFIIGENQGIYTITTGNFIDKTKSEDLKNKIDNVNSLTQEKLDDYFNKCLFDFEFDSSKKAGLGVIDLRIKSGSPLTYSFTDIDSNCDFFSLQTVIITE